MKQSDFIKTISPIIKRLSLKNGYDFPSAIIAQACLESNYGKSGLSKYHNYFGLKCGSKWSGSSVNMKTKEEYSIGTLTEIRDNFRTYEDMESGVQGYFDFINVNRYRNLKTARSTEEYLKLIKEDGYATSSEYVKNNIKVIDKWNLREYDNKVDVKNEKLLSVDQIADEVIAGKWGNGAARKSKLIRAGYNYNDVRRCVNDKLRG